MKHNLVIAFMFIVSSVFAQAPQDSVPALPQYRNIIRFNPTPLILFGPHYYIFGYERVLNPKQSISFNVGFVQMPTLEPLDFDSIEIFDRERKKLGASFAFDYRFYLIKRNKFNMPDGLYIGPYAGYYFFHNELEITSTDASGLLQLSTRNANMHIGMLGFELGYHFIVWKNRLSIDLLLLGPSMGIYNIKIEIRNDIDLETGNLEKIGAEMLDQFPKLSDVVTEGTFTNRGASFSFGMGFRYAVQVGFCF